MKAKENIDFIKYLSQHKTSLLNYGLKINIINNVTQIDDKETKQLILNDFHSLPTGGHAGKNRMYNNLKIHYFWSGMQRDVDEFVKKCDDCQRHKHSRQNKQTMTITSTATSAVHKIFLDFFGPIKIDSLDNSYILTIQCDQTKFVECYPKENKEAHTVANCGKFYFKIRYTLDNCNGSRQGTSSKFIPAIV